jgi:hypothetical protein
LAQTPTVLKKQHSAEPLQRWQKDVTFVWGIVPAFGGVVASDFIFHQRGAVFSWHKLPVIHVNRKDNSSL